MMATAAVYGLARIKTLVREPEGYLDMVLAHQDIASMAGPGQFVMLKSVPGFDPVLPRPFDIVDTSPKSGTFRLLVKVTGRGTRMMEELAPGYSVQVAGPLGKPITDFNFKSCAILFRGCGAAAVLLFIKEAKKQGLVVHAIASAAQADKLVCRNEISSLADTYEIATDDGSEGVEGLGTVVLEKLLAENPVDRIYSCGGGPFYLPYLLEIKEKLPVFLFLESYMACGAGHCHGCAVPRKGVSGKGRSYALV
ncbi:MAG: hypothetical protein EHM28_08230, partial [Spirochaetaceae bacterium]